MMSRRRLGISYNQTFARPHNKNPAGAGFLVTSSQLALQIHRMGMGVLVQTMLAVRTADA